MNKTPCRVTGLTRVGGWPVVIGAQAMLSPVEILFTTLLILAIVATGWFGVYVVYRLYSDQR